MYLEHSLTFSFNITLLVCDLRYYKFSDANIIVMKQYGLWYQCLRKKLPNPDPTVLGDFQLIIIVLLKSNS